MNQTNWASRASRLSSFVLTLTVMGAFITQMKELAKGNDPRDMTEPAFWGRALLNGGSLGFAGDALFNELNSVRRGGGLTGAIGGPMLQFYDRSRNLTIGNMLQVLQGEDTDFAKEALQFGRTYVPIPWQTRLMFERMVYEELLKQADPAAYRRLKQRETERIRDLQQKSWWPEQSTRPERLPDPAAAIQFDR